MPDKSVLTGVDSSRSIIHIAMSLPIVIFTALAWESAAVRSVLRQVRQEGQGVWRGASGGAGNRDVMVVTGGIGPRRTRETVDQYMDTPLSAVISVGCAGALIPGPTTGQLVLAPAVRMYAEQETRALITFNIDELLLQAARNAAVQSGVATAQGAIFTSRRVLFTPQEKEERGRETDCIAVEMESGVHAAFAAERRLPFLVLRVVLDSVDMAIPPMKGVTAPDGQVRLSKAISHIATHPQHLPFLLRLQQCRKQAAASIANVCRAFFHAVDELDLSA